MRNKLLTLIDRNCVEIEESSKNGIIAHHVEVDDLIDDLIVLLLTTKIKDHDIN